MRVPALGAANISSVLSFSESGGRGVDWGFGRALVSRHIVIASHIEVLTGVCASLASIFFC